MTIGVLPRRQIRLQTDQTLTGFARDGDTSAYGELYRRHVSAARTTARCILRSNNDVEDVVAEAFTSALSALRNGRGPRDNFRSYILACVRNACYVRRQPPIPMTHEDLEARSAPLENPEKYVEADTVARAFAALSPRWQHTLWLTEVEQRSAGEVAEQLALAPNATAALTHRARQAFASAYLAEHVGSVRSRECATIAPRLGGYVRHALRASDTALVEQHLVGCTDCQRAVDELRNVNQSLRSLTGAVAGAAAVFAIDAAGNSAPALSATVVSSGVSGSGGWMTGLGAGVLTKVAVAVGVLAVPAAAFQVARSDADVSNHAEAVEVSTQTTVARAEGDSSGAQVQPVVGADGSDAVGGASLADGAVDSSAAAPVSNLDDTSLGLGELTVGGLVGAASESGIVLPPGVTLPGGSPVTVPGDVTVPSEISVPAISVPAVSVPGVSVPGVSVPAISVPAVSVPAVSVPTISVPPISVPPISVPPISVPVVGTVTVPVTVTLPVVTVPVTVTVPVVTVPVTVTVPVVTVPVTVTVPATVTVPTLPVTVPTLPVTVPTLPVTVPTLPVTVPPVVTTIVTLPGTTLPTLPPFPL